MPESLQKFTFTNQEFQVLQCCPWCHISAPRLKTQELSLPRFCQAQRSPQPEICYFCGCVSRHEEVAASWSRIYQWYCLLAVYVPYILVLLGIRMCQRRKSATPTKLTRQCVFTVTSIILTFATWGGAVSWIVYLVTHEMEDNHVGVVTSLSAFLLWRWLSACAMESAERIGWTRQSTIEAIDIKVQQTMETWVPLWFFERNIADEPVIPVHFYSGYALIRGKSHIVKSWLHLQTLPLLPVDPVLSKEYYNYVNQV